MEQERRGSSSKGRWSGMILKMIYTTLTGNRVINIGAILLSATLIALADIFVPPEVPVDAFYVVPIWLGLRGFGLAGGMTSATLSIVFFYFSNYVYARDSRTTLGWSIAVTYTIFVLFTYGAYQFLLSQRQLEQTRLDLQKRLNELNQLYQRSQRLSQENLRLAVIEERNRLAREIHDVLAQGIMAILLQVEVAQSSFAKPERLVECLAQIEQLAHYNLQEARRSVADLRPLPLDGLSLEGALRAVLTQFSYQNHNEPQLEASFSSSGLPHPLSSKVEDALYRIAQEALNNVNCHARASRVAVMLDYDEDEVCLTVEDDGCGFDNAGLFRPNPNPHSEPEEGKINASIKKGYGLSTMQERAIIAGGWATIQSRAGKGCRVRVLVPYSK